MKEELEKLGFQVIGDPHEIFKPLKKYCKRKKFDPDWLYDWMWMYTLRQSHIHYYKNIWTRNYLVLTPEGRDLDSVSNRILTCINPTSWVRWIRDIKKWRVKYVGSHDVQVDEQ